MQPPSGSATIRAIVPVLLRLLVWVGAGIVVLLVGRVRRRGWCVGEQQTEVVALDDLGHRARLDVSNLDERRLEREHVRIM